MTQIDSMLRYSESPVEVPFVDRRQRNENMGGQDRRQFGNSYRELSPRGKELAEAIDQYKSANHRRYITADELIVIMDGLGYQRNA